jgi:hypothetical protein
MANILDPAFWTGWMSELTLLFKFFLGVLVGAVVLVVIALMNMAFGINIGQYMLEIVKFMFESVKAIWLWTITAFHYNNKQEILALGVICFIMFIFLLMAFNVNQMGTAGAISIGSDAVRGSTSGNGATSGAGGYLVGSSSTMPTTGSLPEMTIPQGSTLTTMTTITLPDHCYNSVVDGGETDLNCDGGCIPCHCFSEAQDGDEQGVDCGGSCSDACYCSPSGVSLQCGFGFCCPSSSGDCGGYCVASDFIFPPKDYSISPEEALIACNNGACHYPILRWITLNNTMMGNTNGLLDWY